MQAQQSNSVFAAATKARYINEAQAFADNRLPGFDKAIDRNIRKYYGL
jgi:hypothetical protein